MVHQLSHVIKEDEYNKCCHTCKTSPLLKCIIRYNDPEILSGNCRRANTHGRQCHCECAVHATMPDYRVWITCRVLVGNYPNYCVCMYEHHQTQVRKGLRKQRRGWISMLLCPLCPLHTIAAIKLPEHPMQMCQLNHRTHSINDMGVVDVH